MTVIENAKIYLDLLILLVLVIYAVWYSRAAKIEAEKLNERLWVLTFCPKCYRGYIRAFLLDDGIFFCPECRTKYKLKIWEEVREE